MTEHTKLPWHVEGMTLMCVVSDHAPKGRMRVADIRGWGYLTGKGDGALGLSDDDAFAIQEANAELIVKAVNNHDALTAVRRTFLGYLQAENGCKRSGTECREKCACELELQGLVEAWGGADVGTVEVKP